MNSILKLVQNELIKIYHKISLKILTIFALVLAAAVPLFSYGINHLGAGRADYGAIAREETDPIRKANYQTYADVEAFFEEKNMGEDSWQYRYYHWDYMEACQSLKAMELVTADKEMSALADVMDIFYIEGVERVWENEKPTNKFTYRERTENPLTGEVTYGETEDLTPELARRLKQKFLSEKTKLEKQVNTKFSVYLNDRFKNIGNQYQQARSELDTVEAIYQNNKSVINRYQVAKLKADGLKEILQAQRDMNSLVSTDSLSLKQQSDILNILSNMENTVLNYSSEFAVVATQKEFESDGGVIYYRGCRYTDYNEYLAAAQKQQDTYYQGLKQYSYALSHNIPIARLDRTSTRKNLAETLSINCIIAMFLAMLLSASTVAGEHTSGAIRLLMIRPRSRWKILLSKLLCIMIYTLALIAATSLISTLTEILLHGSEDLAIPYLLISGGSVAEIPPILYYIYWNLIFILPWVLTSCMAFFLSVLAKRAVPALAVPMLTAVFGIPISRMSYDIVPKAKWLKLTPIPYFNISDVFPDPMVITNDWSSPQNYGLTLGGGIAVFLIYSLIMLILAFVIFNKEQIKN